MVDVAKEDSGALGVEAWSGLRLRRTVDAARAARGEWLLVMVFFLGVVLRMAAFEAPIVRSPDEGTFAAQARGILAEGSSSIAVAAERVRHDPSLWFVPSPLRAGYTMLLAGVMRATGHTTELAGAVLSLASSMGCLLLAMHLGRRYLSMEAAILGALFMAVSPLELFIARRAWQEAFTELLALGLIALAAWAISSVRYRRTVFLAFAILGGYCIAVKELAAMVFVFCLLWLLANLLLRREVWTAVALLATCLLASGAAVLWLGQLMHGLGAALDFEGTWLRMGHLNPYAIEYETGTPMDLLAVLVPISPTVFLAGAIGLAGLAALALGRRSAGRPMQRYFAARNVGVACLLAVFTVVFFGLPLISHYRLNLRFAAVAFGTLDLMAGVGLAAVCIRLRKVMAPLGRVAAMGVLGFALSVAAYRDAEMFHDHFLWSGAQDLSLGLLQQAEREVR